MYCCIHCGQPRENHSIGKPAYCPVGMGAFRYDQYYIEGGIPDCRAGTCIHPRNCTRRQECLSVVKEKPMEPIKLGERPEERNGSPEFYKLLEQMADIHSRKSHDYAMASNPFSNFERAGIIASWFTHPVDIAFASLIGVKLARMAELTTGGKKPNNESLDDTQLDLATYAGLWAAWRKRE